MSAKAFAVLRYFLAACLLPLALARTALAEEFIEISVSLQDGRFYSPREFCAECNRKLGSAYAIDQMSDERLELTPLERAALTLAGETGLAKTSITKDRLTLFIANQENEHVRRRQRQRLERLLHIPLTDWPKDKGLHLPNGFDPTRCTLLLVHGLESGLSELDRFLAACHHRDRQAATFDYPNDGPLAWSGDRLRDELMKLSNRHPGLRLAIVAHSMGGLVARHCLEAGPAPRCVTHLFMLATPHHGSSLAGAQEWLELVTSSPLAVALGKDLLRDGLGEAAADLSPGSKFLMDLNACHRAAGVRYYSLIGRRPFVSEARRAALERELSRLFESRATPLATRSAVMQALRSDEMREGLGDGAVSVKSARLEGVTDSGFFELNHLELLALPGARPEDAEVFRWIMDKLGEDSTRE